MLKAVLFDLDDTLLANDMDAFLPRYFDALSVHAKPRIEGARFLPALLDSTRRMLENQDTSRTNRDVFWERFTALTEMSRAEGEPFFERFYVEHFPRLVEATRQVPAARTVVDACFARGLTVVIATNPLFPKLALDERLRWAGLAPERYAFALITSYEDMHATKPHRAYYAEILERIGCSPEAALMVGNDWDADIAPAQGLGLRTFHVTAASGARGKGPEPEGPLEALLESACFV